MNNAAAAMSGPQGLKSVRENFSRPSGTGSVLPLFPGAESAGLLANAPPGLIPGCSSHHFHREAVLTH